MKLIVTAPLARCFAAMLALMLVISAAVRAEPVFSFDATPGKLSKTVVPINYSIELRPDAESLALPGVEVIDIEVREPTARLTLNAVNTTFASVTADESVERADVTIASGILNVKLDTPADDWHEHVLATIASLAALSSQAFAFNSLTSWSDADRMRDDLYYADPAALADHCMRSFSRHVALHHGYGLWEFTIVVRAEGPPEDPWRSREQT